MRVRGRDIFYICSTTIIVSLFVYPLLSTLNGVSWNWNLLRRLPQARLSNIFQDIIFKSECPNKIRGIMKGSWKTRPLSPQEGTEIETFLRHHNGKAIPNTIQRKDNKCGNISDPRNIYAIALCNPVGPTPCCYNGNCVRKSPAECKCPECYDLRTRIHAEYSTWIPDDSRCKWKNFTAQEACRLLQNTELHLVGDSLIRHFYVAVLLLLSSNVQDGAYVPTMPKDVHDACTGMYVFGTFKSKCSQYIKRLASFCNGTTTVKHHISCFVKDKGVLHALVKDNLFKKGTFVLVGVGVHDRFNRRYYEDYFLPAVRMKQRANSTWPILIWATTHDTGLRKNSFLAGLKGQSRKDIIAFNKFMIPKMESLNIPVFDTFDLTTGVRSPDGLHYGLGLNMMKAQLLFNLVEQLQNNEKG